MLKEAWRRLLWLAPTLLLVTIPIFWAVAKLEVKADSTSPSLPLFFNPRPLGVRERAIAVAARIAAGEDEEAEETLARLGGAALPHVLPLLDSLRPEARARVALALSPVARRMGIGSAADLDVADPAVLFWTQFWEEHSIDFRSSIVRRTVRRFAEHPSALRRAEVIDLDTLALEDLVDAMRPIRTKDDVGRVREVCNAAAHVTGQPWTIAENASVRDARPVVNRWETFLLDHESEYVALAGPRRLAATMLETRYGRWVAQLGQRRLGALQNGHSIASTLERRGAPTLFLLLSALIVGYPLATLLGTLSVLRRTTALGVGITLGCLGLAAVSTVGLVALFSAAFGAGLSGFLAACCMIVGTAAAASRHQHVLLRGLAALPHVRTNIAFGATPFRAARREWRSCAPALLALSMADLPGLITAAFVAERAFSLHGLGEVTVQAIRSGDSAWLMALSLVGIFVVGTAQVAVDLATWRLDRRVSEHRHEAAL